ncbi:MAG: alpha/beta fold hydrolase [Cyanobacteria bacterium P01_H01_bin.74]
MKIRQIATALKVKRFFNCKPASPKRAISKFLIILQFFAFFSIVPIAFSGCEMPWDSPKETEETLNEDAETEEEEEAVYSPPPPIKEVDLLPETMQALAFSELKIKMPDQLLLRGRLYHPSLKQESDAETEEDEASAEDSDPENSNDNATQTSYTGPKYPLIILLHGLGKTHLAWGDLPAVLVQSGYAVFSVDLRGHGKSSKTVNNNAVTWRRFTAEHWKNIHNDITAVLQYFRENLAFPEVNTESVGLIGEKLGANIATFAAKDNKSVKTMILISPGLDFKGIVPSQAIVDYNHSVLMMVGKADAYTTESAERLYKWVLGKKSLQIYKKIPEDTHRFSKGSALGENILTWLTAHFPGKHSMAKKAEAASSAGQASKEPGEIAPSPVDHLRKPVDQVLGPPDRVGIQ